MPSMDGVLRAPRGSRLVVVMVCFAACSVGVQSSPTVGTDSDTTTPGSTAAAPATATRSNPTTTVSVDRSLVPTPSQQEGPFYPVSKPRDRDNDLTEINGESGVAGGQVLIISGLLVDTTGEPIQGATIEIWQTDENGIYLHPGDPGVDDRDPAFQGYGESITQSDGSWGFRTINPGYYEPRPRHIHLKVLMDGGVVLTSQVYFSDDPDAIGVDPALIAEVTLDDDGATLVAEHLLVIDG